MTGRKRKAGSGENVFWIRDGLWWISIALGIHLGPLLHAFEQLARRPFKLCRALCPIRVLAHAEKRLSIVEILRHPISADRDRAVGYRIVDRHRLWIETDNFKPIQFRRYIGKYRIAVARTTFALVFGQGGDFGALQAFSEDQISPGLASLLQYPVRQDNLAPALILQWITPPEPAVQRVTKRIPQLPAAFSRRMGVIGKQLAVRSADGARHQNIHFEPTSMGVRADKRLEARRARYPGIGNLIEEPQRLADLITQHPVSGVESRDRNIIGEKGHRHSAVAMLVAQRAHEIAHRVGLTKEKLRCRIATDRDTLSLEVLSHHLLQVVDDGSQHLAIDRAPGMGRKAEDHLPPP